MIFTKPSPAASMLGFFAHMSAFTITSWRRDS
jgi:hypothetical protein